MIFTMKIVDIFELFWSLTANENETQSKRQSREMSNCNEIHDSTKEMNPCSFWSNKQLVPFYWSSQKLLRFSLDCKQRSKKFFGPQMSYTQSIYVIYLSTKRFMKNTLTIICRNGHKNLNFDHC